MSNAISTRQVGERLGVTPRRVRYLARHRPDFPQPLALDGPLLYFDPAAVDRWGETADRTPGAPRGNRNNPHGRRGRPS